MINVNIGGVPEHFNLPWYLTLKEGIYKQENINLRWHDYHEGTGAMCSALRHGDIDMAVILTEGIIKDIIAGNPSKIVQTFVQSPLVWGVHVAHHSKYKHINDLKKSKAAISRYGSGSHLMAYINAENHHWNLETDLNFKVINNLNGAIEGLTSGDADYFLWEKFTTKPLVDRGVFRRIGNCPSPWPCFVIAVREDFISKHDLVLKRILHIINTNTVGFKNIPHIAETISERYEQQLNDVKSWLDITEWSQNQIDEAAVFNVQKKLHALNIIPKIIPYSELTHPM
ncbi:ABC transporter substrate-binding protein [Tamlana fucoidanivorans]|uniref:ABC transporter substrate-binding protein n=1 Tax=Allotamlana fucoidanivorans TaxID=2583814 RepID=A0A5C4SFE9_9FLAO|nr:substrate-binding domain-containing protein [Tamlana fucoidanivorans]TNJ41692.1 ABC transporter substrate-binding protein [Tamlana fucoidanivorans]